MSEIPFHCLVFCNAEQAAHFPIYERLSLQYLAYDLVGDNRDLHSILFTEMRHRVGLKLSLGQRVVVLDEFLAVQKQQLICIATMQGASVIDLKSAPHRVEVLSIDALRTRWKGITVVGDVHGDLVAMRKALLWAADRRHFLWFLGDVIDYGADTLATAEAAYHLVMQGKAAIILGNHERKIARWLDQTENGRSHMRINDGNRITTEALSALKPAARKQWIGRYRALLSHAALMQQIDHVTLLHGAAHPSLWSDNPNPISIEQFALYGEADHSSGKYRRVHRWVDAVPNGRMVFVGHDVMGPFPTVVTGAKGGQVVFLDTGCGTGGLLSTADLRFTDSGLRLECFNRH